MYICTVLQHDAALVPVYLKTTLIPVKLIVFELLCMQLSNGTSLIESHVIIIERYKKCLLSSPFRELYLLLLYHKVI
jgi:hypothetical protein